MSSTGATLKASLGRLKLMVEASLLPWVNEMADMKVENHPSYDKQGVKIVFDALVSCRSTLERASWIQMQAAMLRGRAEKELLISKSDYQTVYDRVVTTFSRARLEGKSWEDQASYFRTELIDETILLRAIEALLNQITVICKAIDDKHRSLTSARFELTAMIDLMKFANTLGEL